MSDWEGETTPHAAEGPQWVSAAEAADAAGVTPGTVRYWARNGLIVSEVVGGPAGEKTLVRLDEVLAHARQGAPAGPGPAPAAPPVTDLPARTSELAPILKSIPEIMSQLTAATDRAARAETKVEFLSAQLSELRRRLAEAEAGRPALEDAVMPPGWDEPARTETPAEDAPGATGWPAPPADAVHPDYGAATSDPVAAEPGPESIDWGAGATEDEGGSDATTPHPDPHSTEASSARSLEDIWARPSRPDPWETAGGAEADVSAPAAPGAPGTSGVQDEVQWHEPSGGSAGAGAEEEPGAAEPPPPPPARAANATVPDEIFYGPRRRRWFKRRK